MERLPTPIPLTSTLLEEHELMVCEPAVPCSRLTVLLVESSNAENRLVLGPKKISVSPGVNAPPLFPDRPYTPDPVIEPWDHLPFGIRGVPRSELPLQGNYARPSGVTFLEWENSYLEVNHKAREHIPKVGGFGDKVFPFANSFHRPS